MTKRVAEGAEKPYTKDDNLSIVRGSAELSYFNKGLTSSGHQPNRRELRWDDFR